VSLRSSGVGVKEREGSEIGCCCGSIRIHLRDDDSFGGRIRVDSVVGERVWVVDWDEGPRRRRRSGGVVRGRRKRRSWTWFPPGERWSELVLV